MIVGTVSLEGLEFFAYHGVSDQERMIGNKYSVDVSVTTDITQAALHDDLSGTVDYSEIYTIVVGVMQTPTKLLEHIGYQIITEIKKRFLNIETVTVSVSKFNPPIGGVSTRSKISLMG
jgi:7,8-dihydroneopterin aldolase/epimerase/oxygenase